MYIYIVYVNCNVTERFHSAFLQVPFKDTSFANRDAAKLLLDRGVCEVFSVNVLFYLIRTAVVTLQITG